MDDYIRYKHNTSVLIPIPPVLYKKIPRMLQVTLFLDLPYYNMVELDIPEPDETTHIAPGKAGGPAGNSVVNGWLAANYAVETEC